MNLYCSLDEAWGSNNFTTNKENEKNNYITSDITNNSSLNRKKNNIENFGSPISTQISKNECKELLNKILSCKECEELLYNYFKYKNNLQDSNFLQNSNFLHNLSNNDIINIILIGLCIIFLLDFFVKIGKLQNIN